MARRLLILHDSPHFGGHEVMMLALLPGLVAAKSYDSIAFAYPAANARLGAALSASAPTIRRLPWPFVKRRGEPYLRAFRLGYQAAVRRLIAAERPDTILLVQGRIENLATAMLAVPRSIRLVSYVPMAHRLRDMGRAGLIGDAARRPLYSRPDAFIVPSAAVARQLAQVGVTTAAVTVAPNVVAPPPATPRTTARVALGLDHTDKIALVLGRLDIAQKGLDRLADAIGRIGDDRRWTFVIVGDGPGRALITALAAGNDRVVALPWTDRSDLYLSAADVLAMPSRWEGLPLAALEAMTYDVPVLGSRIDAFAEMLPPDHLIDWERDDLAAALDRIDAPDARARFAAHSRAYLAQRTLDDAQRAFRTGISGD